MKLQFKLLLLGLCLWPLACSEQVITHTELHGYQEGKLRAKYTTDLFRHKLPDGSSGYLLKTDFRFSVGTRSRVSSTNEIVMNEDFTFVSSKRKSNQNDERVEITIVRDGDQVTILKKDKKGSKEETVPISGPAYLEVPPSLFAKEVTKAGEKKAYPIFYEPIRTVVPMVIKNRGKVTISEGDTTIACIRYGIQSLATGVDYDDYYVTQDTFELVRINNQDLQFSLPK